MMEWGRRVRVPVCVLFLIPLGVLLNVNTFISVTLSGISLLYIYTTYKQSFLYSRGFQGPEPVPFIGDLAKFAKKGFFQLDIDNVNKHGKVFGAYIGNIPTIMVSDPEMVKEICVKQFGNFADHTHSLALPKYLLQTLPHARGDHWKFLRSTISPAFSTGKLRAMAPIIHKCLDSFVLNLERKCNENTDFDISNVFAALTMDIMCCTAFGIEVDSQTNPDDQFVKNAKLAFEGNLSKAPLIVANFFFPEMKYVIEKLSMDALSRPEIGFIRDATKAAIEERKASTSKCNDLLQVMINSFKENMQEDFEETRLDNYKTRGLTDEELLANSTLFLVAGYETTSTTLTWLTYFLALYPPYQNEVIREINEKLGDQAVSYDNVHSLQYLDACLSETLRLYGPVTRINRQILQDTDVCGWKLPAGVSVTMSAPALHRLPDYWPDPEKFDPDRFSPENKDKIHPYSYIPFGEGPRKCVGMRLALMEIKMAAVTFLKKYRVVLSDKQQVPPKIANAFVVKPEAGMIVRLEPRNNDKVQC